MRKKTFIIFNLNCCWSFAYCEYNINNSDRSIYMWYFSININVSRLLNTYIDDACSGVIIELTQLRISNGW